jgi:hypothetical protein
MRVFVPACVRVRVCVCVCVCVCMYVLSVCFWYQVVPTSMVVSDSVSCVLQACVCAWSRLRMLQAAGWWLMWGWLMVG